MWHAALRTQLINLLAALLLLIAFAMLSQRRILSLINLFAWQGLVLPLARWSWRIRPASASVLLGRAHLRAQGAHPAVDPAPPDPQAERQMGRRDAHQHSHHHAGRHRAGDLRLQPGAADLADRRHHHPRARWASRIACVLLSFLMMITRRKAVPQVIGFLAMENGLFFAATSATYGMPMVVELGIALDVLVGMFIPRHLLLPDPRDVRQPRHQAHGKTEGRLMEISPGPRHSPARRPAAGAVRPRRWAPELNR